MSKLVLHAFMLFLLLSPYTCLANIPTLDECWAELAYEGPETLSLYTTPDASGNNFTEAYLPDGTIVDGTITLHMLDDLLSPISDFPFEDIWLQATDHGLTYCPGGTNPDYNTDANGITTWVYPLNAGGYSMGLISVFINGEPLYNSPSLNLNTNSADLTGDLIVNLNDLSVFSTDYFGSTYNYRSDFNNDGLINLLDVTKFASAFRAECP